MSYDKSEVLQVIFLSIIIPHYNSENSLIKLIDTIPLKDEIEVIIDIIMKYQ